MSRRRTTILLDERVLRALRARASRDRVAISEVVERALRRNLGLDVLERARARATLSAQDALELAVDAQHESRRPL